MYYAGIDVGGTSVKLGIFDDAGEMCKSGAVATVREDPYALAQRIAQGLRAMELPFETAGVCTAGCVNLETGLVQASNLGWQDVPLAQILQEALGCPVAIDIPAFLAKAADGDFAGALEIIRKTSLLPAVCGRVCPQEKQCQRFCTMGKLLKDVEKSVAIGRVERFCADFAAANGTAGTAAATRRYSFRSVFMRSPDAAILPRQPHSTPDPPT